MSQRSIASQDSASLIDEAGQAAEAKTTTEVPSEALEDLDLSNLKTKRRMNESTTTDFDTKLKEADTQGEPAIEESDMSEDTDVEESDMSEDTDIEESDMSEDTGIWAATSATHYIPYKLLLSRFYAISSTARPDPEAGHGGRNLRFIPCLSVRGSNNTSIFLNIVKICKLMKLSEEHFTRFIFSELSTSGLFDGKRQLVLKGRFASMHLENILRRYIKEYVSCKACYSLNTELKKGKNRLQFVICIDCSSRRSVARIKLGRLLPSGRPLKP